MTVGLPCYFPFSANMNSCKSPLKTVEVLTRGLAVVQDSRDSEMRDDGIPSVCLFMPTFDLSWF